MELQKNNHNKIQNLGKRYEIITVKETTELLKAQPIINHQDYVTAQNEIAAAILDCVEAMQINLSDRAIMLLTTDLIDKYKYDSIEDILFCLKRGRQGFYGNNYGKLNLIVISEWMSSHLEEKAAKREKQIKNDFKHDKEPIDVIDYESYKSRLNAEKVTKKSNKETEYELHKLNYFKNRENDNNKSDNKD